MVTLDDFVESRLADDELCARAASPTARQEPDTPPELRGDRWVLVNMGGLGESKLVGRTLNDDPVPILPPLGGLTAQRGDDALLDVLTHVANHHPSRITSQVAAGRILLHAFQPMTGRHVRCRLATSVVGASTRKAVPPPDPQVGFVLLDRDPRGGEAAQAEA